MPVYRPGRSAADAAADHGVAGAVKLASNELPWGPLPEVEAALSACLAETNRYPDPRARALRSALAASLGVEPEQVAVGAGAVGLLHQIGAAFLRPGDTVVRAEPSFEAYPVIAALAGATEVPVPVVDGVIDLAAMADAVDGATRLVLVAEPNNPTSTSTGAEKLRLVTEVAGPETLVVLDGAYHEFLDAPRPDVALELARSRPNVLALRTFSKAHGLAALRVGYAVAHPDVVAALDRVAVPFAVSRPAQAAAVASLARPERVEERVAAVRVERRRLLAALSDPRVWSGPAVPTSATNFVWLPVGDDAAALATGLERAGVVTRCFPGVGVRVSVGAPADNDRFLAAVSGWGRP